MIGSLALSAAMADDLPATPQEADILHPTPERRDRARNNNNHTGV